MPSICVATTISCAATGLFGPGSILVIDYEDWKWNPRSVLQRVCAHFEIDDADIPEARTVHSSDFHYRSKLLMSEMQSRGMLNRNMDPNALRAYLLELPPDVRSEIASTVESRFTLSAAQVRSVRNELAEEMAACSSTYGIDVGKWGFSP